MNDVGIREIMVKNTRWEVFKKDDAYIYVQSKNTKNADQNKNKKRSQLS